MPKDTYANTPARRPIRHASPPAGPAPVMCITHTNTKKRNTQAHTLPHLARCSSGRSCSCDGSQLRSTVGTLWDSQAHSPAALPAAAAPDGAAAPAGAREGVGAHGLSASAILWPLGSSSTCCRRTPHKHVHVCARVGGCMRACVREGGGGGGRVHRCVCMLFLMMDHRHSLLMFACVHLLAHVCCTQLRVQVTFIRAIRASRTAETAEPAGQQSLAGQQCRSTSRAVHSGTQGARAPSPIPHASHLGHWSAPNASQHCARVL